MLGDVIRALRNRASLTQKEVADKIKVSVDTVKRWEKNEREPRYTELQKIATALGVSVAELLADEKENPEAVKVEQERSAEAANLKPITLSGDDVLSIPKISAAFKVCAGAGFVYDDVQWEHNGRLIVQDGELAALYSEQSLTAMAVEGDSMYPKFHDGDFVIFNHSPDWITGKAYVVSLDGRLMLKVLVSQGEGKPPKLHSLNPDYADIKVTEDNQLFIIGEVLRVARMERIGFIG